MAGVVVIGAGVTGLAVAVRLADFGHDVTVLERRDVAGGRVGRFAADGVVFDTGPATFTLPAVFRDLFGKTGRRLDREIDVVPVDPAVRYVLPDATIDVPNASRAGTIDAVDAALGPGTGLQWDTVIRRGEQMWRLLRPSILERSMSRRDVAALALRPSTRRAAGLSTSLRHLGAESLDDPRLRMMLDVVATGVGVDPASAPASLAALAYLDHTFGVWTVTGGLHTLVEALERRVRERGGTIRYRSQVTAVVVDRRRVVGVDLADDRRVSADVVVSAIAAHQLQDLVGPARPARSAAPNADGHHPGRRVRDVGSSTFSMFLATRAPGPALPRRTVVADGGAGPTPTIIAPEMPTTSTGGLAGWAVHATCRSHGNGPGEIDWTRPGRAAAFAADVLDLVAARGVELPPTTASWHFQTPFDLERRTGVPGGLIYDEMWSGHRGGLRQLWRRPGYRTAVEGLYSAADPAHPAPGLPMTGMAAVIVSDLVGRA